MSGVIKPVVRVQGDLCFSHLVNDYCEFCEHYVRPVPWSIKLLEREFSLSQHISEQTRVTSNTKTIDLCLSNSQIVQQSGTLNYNIIYKRSSPDLLC